jgi:hypothetical protein
MFYKIRNNNAPSYLCDCLLPFERNENVYNLRNQTDYSNPFTRLQLYRNSFFPSSIKLWNNLPLEIRSAPTVSSFKKSLINDVNLLKPSRYYSYGCRVLNVLHNSRINTKVHCYFEFCKTYLIFFFFDESEVVPIQFRNKAIPN